MAATCWTARPGFGQGQGFRGAGQRWGRQRHRPGQTAPEGASRRPPPSRGRSLALPVHSCCPGKTLRHGRPDHATPEQTVSLSPAVLRFSFLVANHQLCSLLEAAAGDTPLPTLPGHPTSDNTDRGGLVSFLVFHRLAACSELREGSPLLPGRRPASPSPGQLPATVSTTFLLPRPRATWSSVVRCHNSF